MKKLSKILKLLGSLNPEEKAELQEALKEEDADEEQVIAQNDLKDKNPNEVVESKTDGKEDKVELKDKTEAPKVEDSKSQDVKETQKEEVNPALQERSSSVDGQGAEQGVVDEQAPIDNQDIRDINDFVSKEELKQYMEAFEAKYKAKEDEANKLKEELEKAQEENKGMHDKYEKDPFGDMFTEVEPKEKPSAKPTMSFDDYFDQEFTK